MLLIAEVNEVFWFTQYFRPYHWFEDKKRSMHLYCASLPASALKRAGVFVQVQCQHCLLTLPVLPWLMLDYSKLSYPSLYLSSKADMHQKLMLMLSPTY